MRFELTTPTLARLCSTPELRPLDKAGHNEVFQTSAWYMAQGNKNCNRYFM